MYTTKQRIYKYFDKTQKSTLCTFLRSFVRCEFIENSEISKDEIFEKFIDEQEYYLKIESSRLPFIKDYLEDDEFKAETNDYIIACLKYYKYKKQQEPLIAKQKEYDKQKRKFLQELKMSKEPPTKKQLYYYERLCKKYGIEKKDVNTLSKLDIRNEIERIIDEHTIDSRNINIKRD